MIPTDRFLALPDHPAPRCAVSKSRRTGVEIEFAGMGVAEAAELVQDLWGGRLMPQSERVITVEGGVCGRVKVELDISLKKKWAEDLAAQALGDLVPVEIITAPLAQSQMVRADDLVRALRAAGALGTQAKLAYGFGVHLNPELPGMVAAGTDDAGRGICVGALVSVASAYGLLEDWLRQSDPLDLARRVLPFVAPWPPALVDALAAGAGKAATEDVAAFARLYAHHAPTRNHGLDLLPALEHLAALALTDVPPEHLKGGRPTFHYRLPEARLDTENWSIAYEWNRWCLIETVGATPELLAELAEGWQTHRRTLLSRRAQWCEQVEACLNRADIVGRMSSPPVAGSAGNPQQTRG